FSFLLCFFFSRLPASPCSTLFPYTTLFRSLACEVTLQPLDRYSQIDAAILFSDILTIPDAMGQGLYFETGEGPRFKKHVSSLADVEALPIPDPEKDLGYVMDAGRTIRRELNGQIGRAHVCT